MVYRAADTEFKGDDSSNIDLSILEEDADSPPPPKDENCLIVLSRIQRRISNHVPIDTDHDWLDVEIDLPDIQEGHSRKNIFNDNQRLTIYSLLSYGNSIGQDASLKNDVGHEPWLTIERKNNRRFWQRYRERQESNLSWKAVESLDAATDNIMGFLENPLREGFWDRRGLVVGHVQSGKTGNYTGLICKATDAGYKIIIVLAGMHKNLRSQTQMRLDEGFLGYETNPKSDIVSIIGVGEIVLTLRIRPFYATYRADNGGFNSRLARSLVISNEQLIS